MAGALGLLTGLGLGAAAGVVREKRQEQHRHDDMLFDFYSKNPSLVADNPEAQKFVTKYGGKDAAQAFIGMAQHTKAAAEQFGKITGGESQGGGAPTAGPAPAAGGQPSLPMDPNAIEDEQRKLTAFQASPDGQMFEQSHPGAIKAHIDLLEKHAARLQHDQEFQQQQKRLEQNTAMSEQDRALARQGLEAQRQTMNQMHQESIGLQEQNRNFMQQMAAESQDTKRQAMFSTATKNLASQTENIAKMLTAANPADPNTIRALLNARNSQARQLKAQAEKNGIDYDPEQFKPLTTQSAKKYLLGIIPTGTTTSLGEDTAASTAISEGTVIEGPKGDRLVYKGGKWTPDTTAAK